MMSPTCTPGHHLSMSAIWSLFFAWQLVLCLAIVLDECRREHVFQLDVTILGTEDIRCERNRCVEFLKQFSLIDPMPWPSSPQCIFVRPTDLQTCPCL